MYLILFGLLAYFKYLMKEPARVRQVLAEFFNLFMTLSDSTTVEMNGHKSNFSNRHENTKSLAVTRNIIGFFTSF